MNNRHFYESPSSSKGSFIHHLTFDRIRILIWKGPWKSILQSSKLRPVGLPSGARGKELACQCRRCKRCCCISWSERSWSEKSPGGGHGSPLQYSCLENPMDRGAWRARVHRAAQSWTQLKWLSMHTQTETQGREGLDQSRVSVLVTTGTQWFCGFWVPVGLGVLCCILLASVHSAAASRWGWRPLQVVSGMVHTKPRAFHNSDGCWVWSSLALDCRMHKGALNKWKITACLWLGNFHI